MSSLRVLFLGGTGIISSACAARAVEAGVDLHLVTRGTSQLRPPPSEARLHVADVDDSDALTDALGDLEFDAVVDWLAFTPDQVEARTRLLGRRTGQYVFISSASAYQTPPNLLPVTESTPLRNPFMQYSRDKIACEDLLMRAYRDEGLPVTVVRPSHTYDRTSVPLHGGWTSVQRIRDGRPVVVHGDGTSRWTITHHDDLARALVPLLGNSRAIGEAVHITSDDAPTWDQITHMLAAAAGAEARIVHVASESVAVEDPEYGAGLLGDKAHTMVFDNAKIRSLVPGWTATIPFEQGAREMVAWHDADPSRRRIDAHAEAVIDRLVTRYAPPA